MATGHWQAMWQPCNCSRRTRSTLCSCSIQQSRWNLPGFATEAAPAAGCCCAAESFARFARSSPSVPRGCRSAEPSADRRVLLCQPDFCLACASRSCCAKRSPSSLAAARPCRSRSCLSLSHQKVPSCGRHRAGCDPRGALEGCCVRALHFGCLSIKKWAWARVSLKVSP